MRFLTNPCNHSFMLATNFTFSAVSYSRFNRNVQCVKKLVKAGAAICMAMTLTFSTKAQCDTFRNADAANPILPLLPDKYVISAMSFADVDHDGDLDCYVIYHDPAIRKERNQPVFLRNVGDASHPVFKQAENSGFHNKIRLGSSANMELVDIDNDGDYDCF